MPLTIDEKNYSIKIRKGDSGCIVFKFNIPLNNFHVDFCVAKDFNSNITPIISKCYKNINGDTLEVNITSDDTKKFTLEDDFVGQYYWSIKVHTNDGFAATLIPEEFKKTPKFFVYPKLGECPNE